LLLGDVMSEATGRIDARLPLALLRAIQQQDTPPQLMPEENPQQFFPHRLGLSGVVDVQISEFRRLARLRRSVDQKRVEALLELIARRSDASDVFTDAGRQLARYHFSGPLGAFRRLRRRLPQAFRRRAALKALRKVHHAFLVASQSSVQNDPIEIHATDALTARVGEYGGACKMYGSLAAGLLEASGVGPVRVTHSECQRLGARKCVWVVEEGK
jgi:predicted hydrocarbon binding protein